ncbi:hypothetical protein BKA56DRAFT_583674 [Ilyonectria sp. MPI-CAGE-AT-0026]|nr:hypothetical protein BKA56DRAFT_583674 [Ilyonectria sp. MPI-CAGE-AT-0026]
MCAILFIFWSVHYMYFSFCVLVVRRVQGDASHNAYAIFQRTRGQSYNGIQHISSTKCYGCVYDSSGSRSDEFHEP